MKLNVTLFISFLVLNSAAQAWQVHSGDFREWQNSIQALPSVYDQLAEYFKKNSNLPQDQASQYVKTLPQYLKEKSFAEMTAVMANYDNNSNCKTFLNLNFVNQLAPSSPVSSREFEKEMIRIESVSCLGLRSLDSVFEVSMSDDFQKATVNGLKQIKSDPQSNQICHQLSVTGLGFSDYCFTENIWKDGESYVIHSFNEVNSKKATAFVYFREILTVVRKLKSGEVMVYNLAYGRGPDLPFHSIVLGMIKSQHPTYISELQTRSH